MITKGQGVFIMLLLSLIVIVFIIVKQPMREGSKSEETVARAPSGFPDYDLIPEVLKQKMDSLKKTHHNINYSFWYYFDIEDVNKNYYITDADIDIIHDMPVTNPDALALVEEKILDNPDKDADAAFHPDMIMNSSASKEEREKKIVIMREHKDDPSHVWIRYIFPEDSVDFSKLRVAIVADNLSRGSAALYSSKAYDLKELDSLPVPVRGYAYFEELIVKELMKHEVFTFYDLKGEVTMEFTVGSIASSPNLVEGFSSRHDTYEAYRADGAFIKALNNLKVWWKPGKVGNSPVRVKIPVTFQVDGQTIKMKKEPNAMADL